MKKQIQCIKYSLYYIITKTLQKWQNYNYQTNKGLISSTFNKKAM